MPEDTMQVLFLGDSQTFHGPDGRLPITDARLYQNILANTLGDRTGREVQLTLLARAGWTTRDVWDLVTKHPWVNERLLPEADLVVLSSSTADVLPVGIPTWIKDGIPRIPQPRLRRWVRGRYWAWHRYGVRAMGGRLRYLPSSVTYDLWPRLVKMIRFYSGNTPIVATSVSPVKAEHHGSCDPHSEATSRELLKLAREADVPMLDLQEVCRGQGHLFADDGLHWDYGTHERAGKALADLAVIALEDSDQPDWIFEPEPQTSGGT